MGFIFSGSIIPGGSNRVSYSANSQVSGTAVQSTGYHTLAMLSNPSSQSVFLRHLVVNANMIDISEAATKSFILWGGLANVTSSVGALKVEKSLSTVPVGGSYSSGSLGSVVSVPLCVGPLAVQTSAVFPPIQGQQGSDIAQEPFVRFDLVQETSEVEIIPGYSFAIGIPDILDVRFWNFSVDFHWSE